MERTHLLVLWSRLGNFQRDDLKRLLWEERLLFEHMAWIVPTEAYPWRRLIMRSFASGAGAWQTRLRNWLTANDALRREILARLRNEGPLKGRDFKAGPNVTPWRSGGWSDGRNVGRMLDLLFAKGEILVSRREGNERIWDLADRVVPEWTPREELSPEEALRGQIEAVVRRSGVAEETALIATVLGTSPEIRATTAQLVQEGVLCEVRIEAGEGSFGAEGAFVHRHSLPLLDEIESGHWKPRTALLSPFDPLISDRDRTERLFDFQFRLEMYLPKEKRRYGYFVLPILHGDRLIGRVDPQMDRRAGRLNIMSLHFEGKPTKKERAAVRAAIEELGQFLGASEIIYK